MPASRLNDRDLLARLIAFDTTSHQSNLPLAEFLADYLDRPGVRIARHPSPDDSKANLVVTAGPETDDRHGLTLSGHMDVVPATEPEWDSDPFVMLDVGDRYVGRGTADMKGFLALAANRVAGLEPGRLRRPLALVFTYDEEVGTVGARRLTESFAGTARLPRQVVIGEPTQLRAVRAHKGMVRLNLRFTGRAAHSGYPHLGRSAIEPAALAMVGLADLRRTLEAERPPNGELFADVPYVALNIGTVAGGSAANVIPDRCDVQLGIRVLPGMTTKDVASRVRAAIADATPEPFTLEAISESPAMLLDRDAPIHLAVCEAVGQHDEHSVMFASDAGWLQRAGFACVLFGPGSIEVAHKPNESLPVDQFRRAGDVLDGLIHRSCVRP
ncbi:MAG TPA: acetylornithine deacetylase [Gemmatimonadales bacterium]|nr:acetylornithine deacetylase [Gemmatimonadales bacterium]